MRRKRVAGLVSSSCDCFMAPACPADRAYATMLWAPFARAGVQWSGQLKGKAHLAILYGF